MTSYPGLQRVSAALLVTVLVAAAPSTRPAEPLTRPDAAGIVDRLLRRATPPTDWKAYLARNGQYTGDGPPPAGVTDDVLADYWGRGEEVGAPPEWVRARLLEVALREPSRLPDLLAALPDTPEAHDRLKALYDRHAATATVTSPTTAPVTSPATGPATAPASPSWLTFLHDWLMTQSPYFRDDLVRAAGQARIRNDTTPEGWEAVEALARLDWPAAEPLLKRWADGDDPAMAALATVTTYRRQAGVAAGAGAAAEKAAAADRVGAVRKRLQGVASDRTALRLARARAIEALMATDWPGRDDWFLSLLRDPTTVTLVERRPDPDAAGQFGDDRAELIYEPLGSTIRADPDRWVPRLAALVARPAAGADEGGQAARESAIACLRQLVHEASYRMGEPHPGAVRALLPWLTDPGWAGGVVDPGARSDLLAALASVEAPEAVPSLLALLKKEDDSDLAAVADALARNPALAVDAGPRLRAAMERATDKWDQEREPFARALLAVGALTDAEVADSVEAFLADEARLARAATTQPHQGFFGQKSDDPQPVRLSMGRLLGNFGAREKPLFDLPRYYDPRHWADGGLFDRAAARLVERSAALRRAGQADVADGIDETLATWPVAAVDRELARRIGAGEISARTLVAAVERAESMRKNAPAALRDVAAGKGHAAGAAAALLADEAVARRVIEGDDRPARAMLLACARLARTPLPLAATVRLLDAPDPLVVRAADRYLEAEDSPEARRLWARSAGQVRVLGRVDPYVRWTNEEGEEEDRPADAPPLLEDLLREEMRRAGGPDEIYALDTLAGEGRYAAHIVRIRAGRAAWEVRHPHGKRLTRPLTPEELADFRAVLAGSGADDLPALAHDLAVHPTMTDYLHLTPTGGRRVAMANAEDERGTPYEQIVKVFKRLGRTGDFAIRYVPLSDHVPAARVVVSYDENPPLGDPMPVTYVWKRGDDLRVFVHDGYEPLGPDLEPGAWWSVRDARLVGPTSQPADVPILGARDDVPRGDYTDDSFRWNWHQQQDAPGRWQSTLGGDVIRRGQPPGTWDSYLFRCRKGAAPVLIPGTSDLNHPVATPGGRWLVAEQRVVRDDKSSYRAVRLDGDTGNLIPVDLSPAARELRPVAYVAPHGRVLLRRRDDAKGEEEAAVDEYFLLDAATGKTERAAGEFRPLLGQSLRPLQPTGRANEVWAALPEGEKYRSPMEDRKTVVGRYDTNGFRFTPVLALPGVSFDSMDMWIDASEGGAGAIYFAYYGDLIRVPLPR